LEVLTALVMHVATPHGAISQKMITLMVVTWRTREFFLSKLNNHHLI
jgi:hypothetical protein